MFLPPQQQQQFMAAPMSPASLMQSLTATSLMQSLGTGNAALDMILSILIMTLVTRALSWVDTMPSPVATLGWLLAACRSFWRGRRETSIAITFKCLTRKDDRGGFYLSEASRNVPKWFYDAVAAHVTEIVKKPTSYEGTLPKLWRASDNKEKYRLTSVPASGVYVPKWDTTFTFDREAADDVEKGSSVCLKVTLTSLTRDVAALSEIVDEIITKRERDDDTAKREDELNWPHCVYTLSSKRATYRRTPFQCSISRDSFFFPGKDDLLDYALSLNDTSVARKMVLLLHGPPGCGKTSFIKALGQATGRHLFMISLRRIEDQDMLRDVFISKTASVLAEESGGPDLCKKFDHRARIFVIEEIDVDAPKLIMCRKKAAAREALRRDARRNRWATRRRGSDLDDDSDLDDVVSGDEEACGDTASNGTAEEVESPRSPPNRKRRAGKKKKGGGGLAMADLLNLLDGVVELPHGTIVVMTTNHVEMIDEAIKRPGRVTHNVELGHMRWPELCQFMSHCWPGHVFSDAASLAAVEAACPFASPAQIDCLRLQHERDPDAFLRLLLASV